MTARSGLNDPPAITDLDSPNKAINVKSTDRFRLPVPDWRQTRVHSIRLAECDQCEDCSRIAISLEVWFPCRNTNASSTHATNSPKKDLRSPISLYIQRDGLIHLSTLKATIRPQQTVLVSSLTVNNETGVIQPLQQIGELVKRHRGVYFHTDTTQALGKIPLDVESMNVDLMSLSGRKVHGPKGVGGVYVLRRLGVKRGLRSGTLRGTLIVGMGEACRIAKEEMEVGRAQI